MFEGLPVFAYRQALRLFQPSDFACQSQARNGLERRSGGHHGAFVRYLSRLDALSS
jgi:hypothetical protein